MNWFNNFSGGFNNGRTSYGGGNPGGWGNSGAVQASYGENTQTLPNLNTQSTMNSTYGASFASANNSGGWGNAGGFGLNTGWGNRLNDSGRYYNYANQFQPYDNFLINGFNPGYAQNNVVATRDRRRAAEQTIDRIGQVGFWGRGANYPESLYNGGLNYYS
jgi:hypothetical protein